jgi:hypothetical protein
LYFLVLRVDLPWQIFFSFKPDYLLRVPPSDKIVKWAIFDHGDLGAENISICILKEERNFVDIFYLSHYNYRKISQTKGLDKAKLAFYFVPPERDHFLNTGSRDLLFRSFYGEAEEQVFNFFMVETVGVAVDEILVFLDLPNRVYLYYDLS